MTEPDKNRRLELLTTTPAQDLAIEVLITGGTTFNASEAANVSRQTISLWRNHHPGFKAALNSRRRELLAERADRVRDLDTQALAVMAEAIDAGDRAMALAWVKTRHLHLVNVTDVGHTRAEAILNTEANKLRDRPEHVGSLHSILDDTNDRYSITRGKARDLAEAELVEILEEATDDN